MSRESYPIAWLIDDGEDAYEFLGLTAASKLMSTAYPQALASNI